MHQPSIYIFLLTFIVPTTNLGVGKFDVYLQVFGVFVGRGRICTLIMNWDRVIIHFDAQPFSISIP